MDTSVDQVDDSYDINLDLFVTIFTPLMILQCSNLRIHSILALFLHLTTHVSTNVFMYHILPVNSELFRMFHERLEGSIHLDPGSSFLL